MAYEFVYVGGGAGPRFLGSLENAALSLSLSVIMEHIFGFLFFSSTVLTFFTFILSSIFSLDSFTSSFILSIQTYTLDKYESAGVTGGYKKTAREHQSRGRHSFISQNKGKVGYSRAGSR